MTEPLDSAPDEALVARIGARDARAFEILMSRYRRSVFNFILRSVRDRELAAELHQEVFLRVAQRAAEFQGEAKVSTWIFTIARNLCIDTSRKMAFRRHRSLDETSGEDADGPSLVERTAGAGAGVERQAIGSELRRRLLEAIDALPPEQREVFLMREVHDMPFRDIAAVVGAPENTVKSRMRYALERLQRALTEYEDYVPERT
ncbi:MAG: RNA polymerase sigma factor [Myxococcales bacterium]|nr:RNA polymerase sigma factor [Myxococcales bacterium]